MADTTSGRDKILYNSIMKRWLYQGDIDTNPKYKKSVVFKEGYDDPTYMTFKIEFGDWGASILDRSVLQLGTTEFRPYINDYDALPIGLLNCPQPDNSDTKYWQNEAFQDVQIFNKVDMYSAFQYLRSRNEDTRAKYLYYFVNGLFEIQRDYPFIFKKVSGLSELEKMDPKAGQRLKNPVKITVECFESLNLKIRTLFEFYRKAAWDDVYQRWILPENMRQFKMIIYVFERRIFQDTQMFNMNVNGSSQTNMIMNYSSLNGDIPVKAYECIPCEFNISESMSWGNDYSSGTDNNEETSKFVIEVKNVKTYYKNGLLTDELSKIYNNNGSYPGETIEQKIDSIMIYDLVDGIERWNDTNRNSTRGATSSSAYSDLTVNGAKALFLNKNILLENEEANPRLKSYVWGLSQAGYLTANDDIGEFILKERGDKWLSWIEDNEAYRGGWLFSLPNAPSYNQNKTFWQNLGDNIMNVLTGTRRLVLLSGATFIHLIDNCLIDSFFIPPYSYEPILPYDNGLGKNKRVNTNLTSRTVNEQEFGELQPERNIKDQKFTELTNRNIPEQEYQDLEKPRTIDKQQFTELTNRNIPDQNFNKMLPERDVHLHPDLNLKSRYISEQEYKKLKPERQISKQDFANIKNPRELTEQDYKELAKERIPDTELLDLILLARTLPGFKDMSLDEIRKLPKQDLKDLANATNRSLPSFKLDKKVILDEINKVEGSNVKLLELDKDNKAIEEKALELLKQNKALPNIVINDDNLESADEKSKKLKAIMSFTKEFTENSEKIKKTYVDSVLEMKSKLRDVTREIVNKLPLQDTYIIKKGEKDTHNINSALASQNDIDQINANMKYIAIQDTDIEKLSFQTLIQLHEEIGNAVQRSEAISGLTSIVKNSVATNPDEKFREKAKHSVIEEPKKNKMTIIY